MSIIVKNAVIYNYWEFEKKIKHYDKAMNNFNKTWKKIIFVNKSLCRDNIKNLWKNKNFLIIDVNFIKKNDKWSKKSVFKKMCEICIKIKIIDEIVKYWWNTETWSEILEKIVFFFRNNFASEKMWMIREKYAKNVVNFDRVWKRTMNGGEFKNGVFWSENSVFEKMSHLKSASPTFHVRCTQHESRPFERMKIDSMNIVFWLRLRCFHGKRRCVKTRVKTGINCFRCQHVVFPNDKRYCVLLIQYVSGAAAGAGGVHSLFIYFN